MISFLRNTWIFMVVELGLLAYMLLDFMEFKLDLLVSILAVSVAVHSVRQAAEQMKASQVCAVANAYSMAQKDLSNKWIEIKRIQDDESSSQQELDYEIAEILNLLDVFAAVCSDVKSVCNTGNDFETILYENMNLVMNHDNYKRVFEENRKNDPEVHIHILTLKKAVERKKVESHYSNKRLQFT